MVSGFSQRITNHITGLAFIYQSGRSKRPATDEYVYLVLLLYMEPGTYIYLRSVSAICPQPHERGIVPVCRKAHHERTKKKDLFLQAGKVQKSIGFIATGLVRSFFIDQEGIETTVGFYPEGD